MDLNELRSQLQHGEGFLSPLAVIPVLLGDAEPVAAPSY